MAAIINCYLVSYDGGTKTAQVSSAASIDEHGRREAFLALDDLRSLREVDRIARKMLVDSGVPTQTVTTTVEPTESTDEPWVDWSVGDWVSVPDSDGDVQEVRVRSLSVTEDAEGNPFFTPELGTLADERQNRLARWLNRMALGTVGGRSESASPGGSPASGVYSTGGQESVEVWGGMRLTYASPFDGTTGTRSLLPAFDSVDWEAGIPIRASMQPTVSRDGTYRIVVDVKVYGVDVGAGVLGVSLIEDGAGVLNEHVSTEVLVNCSDEGETGSVQVGDVFPLAAGEGVEVWVEPPSDASLNLVATITVERVGPYVPLAPPVEG